jgi:hypothetical protein
MSNEVITLQFGNYSNYIGAHYWNIQVYFIFELVFHMLVTKIVPF